MVVDLKLPFGKGWFSARNLSFFSGFWLWVDGLEDEFVFVFAEDDFVVVEDGSSSEEDGEVAAVGDEDFDVLVVVGVAVAVDGHSDVGAAEAGFAAGGVDAAGFGEFEFEEFGDGVRDDDEVSAGVEEGIDKGGLAAVRMEFDGDERIVVVVENEWLGLHLPG